jgi:hypothetical protein
VTILWQILTQFIFRLTFGVSLAMSITPARLVTSGFYRVHLWVLMGLNTFAALAIYSSQPSFAEGPVDGSVVFGFAIAAAVISYIGSVIWLYEKPRAGGIVLFVVTLTALLAAVLATPWRQPITGLGVTLGVLDLISGGLLLGSTMAAMLLGHWYLNTPTMELVPLRRLVLLMVAAIIGRTLLSAAGLSLAVYAGEQQISWWLFITLRWLSGLLGTMMLALLTWQTLKIPNTQSATGILYAGLILTFIGELTAALLSVDSLYPL